MTNTATIRPAWTPVTIGLMVLGFVVFWPLGLAMLAYILWGDRLHAAIDEGRTAKCARRSARRNWRHGATGNAAFDEYRQSEFDRLEKERRRLEEERAEFEEFLANLRRAKDQDEFDRFMSDRASRKAQGNARDDGTIEL
jgi:hypothetical protein